jgi:hypothetical protein
LALSPHGNPPNETIALSPGFPVPAPPHPAVIGYPVAGPALAHRDPEDAMSGMDFIKLSTRYLDWPKLGRLPEAYQARWFKLLLLAGECDADGLITYTLEEIAFRLHLTVDELVKTLKALEAADPAMYRVNGRGPEIPLFASEQVSRAIREQKRDDNRRRQEEFRNKKKCVSNALVSHLESESEKESESERESEEESVSPRPTDATSPVTADKATACKAFEIHEHYSARIIADPKITVEDLVAEYSRNMARKSKLKNPASVTAINLLKHELPADQWYTPSRWQQELTAAQQSAIGLSGIDTESETLPDVATRISEEDEPSLDVGNFPPMPATTKALSAWQQVLYQIKTDTPRTSFSTRISDAVLIGHADGIVTIGARADAVDWLTSRATKTVENLLSGPLSEQVRVRFVAPLEGGNQK